DKLAREIKRAGETGDLSRLARMIGNDPSLLAQHMANPTAVKREPLNEVNSFGTGMTPLYGALALWVGALITSVVVHTRISERGEETEEALDPERYSRAQAYLGRFGIFALIGTVDRKSTRLNSSHVSISYAVFCLKKKNQQHEHCLL